jgi:hypothetical protein
MVAEDIVPDEIEPGGEWYEGETGSCLSASKGGCKVFSVGKAWTLGVCRGVGIEGACGDVE